MVSTLARAARQVGVRFAPLEAVEEALWALGAKADEPLEGLSVERRVSLVAAFVRGLRGVGVAKCTDLERVLLQAVEATPRGLKIVPISDPISLVAARNHVSSLATAVGMPWAESMKLQAAFSDLARQVSGHGGGLLETVAHVGRVECVVRAHAALQPEDQPAWLVALRAVVGRVVLTKDAAGTMVEFAIQGAAPRAAA